MNNQKIASNYISALTSQSQATNQFNQALNTLGSDNFLFSLAEPLESAYTSLVQELLGENLWGWLMWWMYDADMGTRPMDFQINNQEYCPTQMTFEQFWNLVSV